MHRFFLRLLQLFCLLFLMTGIFIALLPSLINTDWGRRQVIQGVNHLISGEIEIQMLHLQWTKRQTIRGFTLKDPKGKVILKVESLSIDVPLWKLLTQGIHAGFVQIKELSAMLAIDEEGKNNFQYAFGMASPLETGHISQLVLSHVNANLHIFAPYHSFVLWAQGMTQQQDLEGFFEVDLVLNGLRLSNWKNFISDIQHYFHEEGSRRAAIQMKVIKFPTDVIDRLFFLKSSRSRQLFRFLMGSHVNIVLNKEPNAEGLLIAKIQAPFIEGKISGRIVNSAFILQEPANLHLDVTTELLQAFTDPRTQLYQQAQIDISFPYLFFPLAFLNPQAKHDFCQCGFKVDIAISKTEMNVYPLGLLNIHHLKAQLDSKSGDPRFYFKSTGYVESDTKPVFINSEQWFKKASIISVLLNDPTLENLIAESDPALQK